MGSHSALICFLNRCESINRFQYRFDCMLRHDWNFYFWQGMTWAFPPRVQDGGDASWSPFNYLPIRSFTFCVDYCRSAFAILFSNGTWGEQNT